MRKDLFENMVLNLGMCLWNQNFKTLLARMGLLLPTQLKRFILESSSGVLLHTDSLLFVWQVSVQYWFLISPAFPRVLKISFSNFDSCTDLFCFIWNILHYALIHFCALGFFCLMFQVQQESFLKLPNKVILVSRIPPKYFSFSFNTTLWPILHFFTGCLK